MTIPLTTREQLTVLAANTAAGSLAAAQQGAHVYAWQPASDSRPVLFLSPRSHFAPGKAIRGGVPLCFPWFGPHASDPRAPQHGFARTATWAIDESVTETDGTMRLAFGLRSTPATRDVWPHAFEARFTVRAADSLRLALEVRNTDTSPFTFGAALHTYLAVSDVRHIAVHGLEDTPFLDKVGGDTVPRRQGPGPLTFSGETDRIYLPTTATCVVEDAAWARRIHVAKAGSRSTVVWTPWTDKARAMSDLGEDAWPGFVCIETCNAADDTVTLAPGERHTLSTTLSVEPN